MDHTRASQTILLACVVQQRLMALVVSDNPCGWCGSFHTSTCPACTGSRQAEAGVEVVGVYHVTLLHAVSVNDKWKKYNMSSLVLLGGGFVYDAAGPIFHFHLSVGSDSSTVDRWPNDRNVRAINAPNHIREGCHSEKLRFRAVHVHGSLELNVLAYPA